MRSIGRDDSGQAAPLVAVTLLGLIAVTALVVDGGVLFAARRNLQSLADGAARAGAMEVDERALRQGAIVVRLEPEAARAAALDYLASSGFTGDAQVVADHRSVRVRLSEARPPLLLTITGVRNNEIQAEAEAVPRTEAEAGG